LAVDDEKFAYPLELELLYGTMCVTVAVRCSVLQSWSGEGVLMIEFARLCQSLNSESLFLSLAGVHSCRVLCFQQKKYIQKLHDQLKRVTTMFMAGAAVLKIARMSNDKQRTFATVPITTNEGNSENIEFTISGFYLKCRGSAFVWDSIDK